MFLLKAVREGEKETFLNLKSYPEALLQIIDAAPECRVVILDPIKAYSGGVNVNDESEVRDFLKPITDILEERQVTLIAMLHNNKNEGIGAIHRIAGSGAWVQVARSVWHVIEDKEDSTRR